MLQNCFQFLTGKPVKRLKIQIFKLDRGVGISKTHDVYFLPCNWENIPSSCYQN